MKNITILMLGAASLIKGSLVPFLNAVTRIVCGCFLYCDFIFRPENKNSTFLCKFLSITAFQFLCLFQHYFRHICYESKKGLSASFNVYT